LFTATHQQQHVPPYPALLAPEMPLSQAWQAGLWTLLAALSLPVGATVGLLAAPISQTTVAACMAFGAGALIFAIAIELYGSSVSEMRSGEAARYELALQSVATIIGAVVYVAMDHFLLHRPTVGTDSLQKFGLRGPSPMSRNEWLDAEAEREDKYATPSPDIPLGANVPDLVVALPVGTLHCCRTEAPASASADRRSTLMIPR
jgi:hypothetical protein